MIEKVILDFHELINIRKYLNAQILLSARWNTRKRGKNNFGAIPGQGF